MFDFELNEKDLRDITLNGKKLKQLIDADLKQMIINHLFQTYNIKMSCTNKYFKAIDPVTDTSIIKRYKHLAYINTNQRICLLILATFKCKNVCLLIDKQNSIIYVLKCQFRPSLYQGTIFEGEMVDTYFMISDFLVYMQKNIVSHALDRRITLLNSIISSKNYQYDSLLDPFRIMVKDFVDCSELSSYVHEYLPTTPYKDKVSGIIFRPNENSNRNLIYNFGQHVPVPKIANGDPIQLENETDQLKINIDKYTDVKFLLFETGNPDDYRLKLFNNSGQLIDYDYALINDMKTSQYFQKLLDETPYASKKMGICVLCHYLPNFKKWKPMHVSEEKVPDNIMKLI